MGDANMLSNINALDVQHVGHDRRQMRRPYLRTHPWLSFGLDLRPASRKLWLALGEAQSKCLHLAGTPLRPEFADRLHYMYLAKGVLATTAIEGNTLSEEEVLAHMHGRLELPPSREYLRQEIDNILALGNELLDAVAAGSNFPISIDLVKHFNKNVLNNLPVDEDTVPGEIRKDSRVVGRYRCAPPEDCEYLLDRLCEWLNSNELQLEDGNEIVCGIIRAVVSHIYFVWIHPFGDGNGRTARLIEVKLLLDAGVPSDAAHLLSNYYNKTRSEYYKQLDNASRQGGNILPFIEYAVIGFVEELREHIDVIRQQHIEVTWVNYVHDQFKDKKSAADRRRRTLVLALSNCKDPVRTIDIPKINPEVATEYANKTIKTTFRDLDHLRAMGLIEFVRNPVGHRVKKEIVMAFLPTAKKTPR
jgi:Fic family protein